MTHVARLGLALLVVSFTVPSVTVPLGAQVVRAPDAITPGEFVIDPPTLINLGFEWLVEGDRNRTANVEVSYRKTGDTTWRAALPLLRLDGERIKSGRQIDVTVPQPGRQ